MEERSPALVKKMQSATKSDNQSVSSQQLNRLSGLPGHKMLAYMHSPLFGQHGESTRLADIIQEFIARLTAENESLHSENDQLRRSNSVYQNLI